MKHYAINKNFNKMKENYPPCFNLIIKLNQKNEHLYMDS